MNKTISLSSGQQIELNKAQYEAVTHEDGPLLIIAGAGTGKTKTLVSRVVYLISERHVPEEKILMLTFTNQAAKEMKERICQYTGQKTTQITACTYHSFCNRILRKYARLFGYTPNFTLCDASDTADIIDLLRTKRSLKLDDPDFPSEKTIASLLSRSINKKEPIKCIVSNFYEDYIGYIDDIIELCNAYMLYKREHDILDYDDLLLFVNNLFKARPLIAQQISSEYMHICVDEYQDSNAVQAEFLSLIRGFDNKNICVVGDDMQSIYAFRGADVQNILNFPKLFDDCKVIKLTENYRSSQEILDLSNHVVSLAKTGFPKKLHGQKNGAKPEYYHFRTQEESILYILADIKQRKEAGAKFNDFAILVRGKISARAFEIALRQNYRRLRIPYRKFGGMKFTEQSHIKDVMAFVHLLVNDRDEISWFRALRIYPAIGKAYANNIAGMAERTGLSALSNKIYQKRAFYENLQMLQEFIQTADSRTFQKNLKQILYDLYIPLRELHIKEAKVENETARAAMRQRLDEDKKDIRALYDVSMSYKTARAFLADFSGNQKDKDDAITLTTVHSAKGLEWDTVYLLDCVEETFNTIHLPGMDSGSKWVGEWIEDQKEENIRLFYVALTRAKNRLVLLEPQLIMQKNCTPACFMQEADRFIEKSDGELALLRKPERVLPNLSFKQPVFIRDIIYSSSYRKMRDTLLRKNENKCQCCGLSIEDADKAVITSSWNPINKRNKNCLVLSGLYCLCESCTKLQDLSNVKGGRELDEVRAWHCHITGTHPQDERIEENAVYEIHLKAEKKARKNQTSFSYCIKESDMYDIVGFMPEIKSSADISVIECSDSEISPAALQALTPADEPKPEKALITAVKATDKQLNYIRGLCFRQNRELTASELTKAQASDLIEYLLGKTENQSEAEKFLA